MCPALELTQTDSLSPSPLSLLGNVDAFELVPQTVRNNKPPVWPQTVSMAAGRRPIWQQKCIHPPLLWYTFPQPAKRGQPRPLYPFAFIRSQHCWVFSVSMVFLDQRWSNGLCSEKTLSMRRGLPDCTLFLQVGGGSNSSETVPGDLTGFDPNCVQQEVHVPYIPFPIWLHFLLFNHWILKVSSIDGAARDLQSFIKRHVHP